MKNIAREPRAISSETLRELRRRTLPVLAIMLYVATSFILAHDYRSEDDETGATHAHTWARTHTFLGIFGSCALFILALSGALGWLGRVDAIFWQASLTLYTLGAFAFWMCMVAEPGALDRLAHSLNLPLIEN